MKITLCFVAVIILFASAASAETIAEKFGFDLMGGSKVNLDMDDYDNNWGPAFGGGFIYGISDSVAIDFNMMYSQVHLTDHRLKDALAKTIDLALGIQYRFFPTERFVPYLGIGAAVVFPNIRISDAFAKDEGVGNSTDTGKNIGGFAKGGLDYFVSQQIALSAEAKETYATDSDIKANGRTIAVFDAKNLTVLVGVKVFFK
jgi:outer membrane protein